MPENFGMKIKVESGDIVIRMPIDDLVFIIENDPEYKYKVHDKKKLADAMVYELENSKSLSNNDGMNAVEELFQNAYEHVYENGEDEIITGKDVFEP